MCWTLLTKQQSIIDTVSHVTNVQISDEFWRHDSEISIAVTNSFNLQNKIQIVICVIKTAGNLSSIHLRWNLVSRDDGVQSIFHSSNGLILVVKLRKIQKYRRCNFPMTKTPLGYHPCLWFFKLIYSLSIRFINSVSHNNTRWNAHWGDSLLITSSPQFYKLVLTDKTR